VTRYIIISGQHGAKALMELREEALKNNQPLPEYLRHFRGDVLLHDTPLEVRELLAGDEQFRQSVLEPLKLSDWVHHFVHTAVPDDVTDEAKVTEYRVKAAIRKCGYTQNDSTAVTMKQWGGLARFVKQFPEDAESLVKNIERAAPDITVDTLRSLRGLLTPDSRVSVMQAMGQPGITLGQLEKAMGKSTFDMWVTFHWHGAPSENIGDPIRIPSSASPARCPCHAFLFPPLLL
jgi:hypothetical protein